LEAVQKELTTMACGACVSLLFLSGVLTLASAEPDPEIAQAREAALLSPDAFPALPSSIRADLASRACRVPQSYVGERPQNAISGQFQRPGQTDWAVLCFRDDRSTILVYWGADVAKVEELEPVDNPGFHFERTPGGEVRAGFYRALSAVDEDYIVEHYDLYGEGPKPPPIDHQGIDDTFVEKGSTVLYWHRGRWLRLAGAD
jgi:hypothetical protein